MFSEGVSGSKEWKLNAVYVEYSAAEQAKQWKCILGALVWEDNMQLLKQKNDPLPLKYWTYWLDDLGTHTAVVFRVTSL